MQMARELHMIRIQRLLSLPVTVHLVCSAPLRLPPRRPTTSHRPSVSLDPDHGYRGRSANQGCPFGLSGDRYQRDRRVLPSGSRGATAWGAVPYWTKVQYTTLHLFARNISVARTSAKLSSRLSTSS